MTLLFFVRQSGTARQEPVAPPPGCHLETWRPSLVRLPPRGLPARFHVWWLFHHLRIFREQSFGVHMLRRGSRLDHYCVIFPPFFRFPFMAPGDVQIGDVWTAPAARRQGLARCGATAVLADLPVGTRQVWYITAADNLASIRLIEGLGFTLIGRGERRHRLGLPLLGYYRLAPETCSDVMPLQ